MGKNEIGDYDLCHINLTLLTTGTPSRQESCGRLRSFPAKIKIGYKCVEKGKKRTQRDSRLKPRSNFYAGKIGFNGILETFFSDKNRINIGEKNELEAFDEEENSKVGQNWPTFKKQAVSARLSQLGSLLINYSTYVIGNHHSTTWNQKLDYIF